MNSAYQGKNENPALPHNTSAINKKPIPSKKKKKRELVPKFAARWQLFCEYFLTPTNNNQMKQNPNSKYIENTRFTLKEDLNI